jgi:hypothetical protein
MTAPTKEEITSALAVLAMHINDDDKIGQFCLKIIREATQSASSRDERAGEETND